MVVKIGGGGGGGGTALTVFYLLQYRMGGDQSEGGAIKWVKKLFLPIWVSWFYFLFFNLLRESGDGVPVREV
jgi:hypothetical protein